MFLVLILVVDNKIIYYIIKLFSKSFSRKESHVNVLKNLVRCSKNRIIIRFAFVGKKKRPMISRSWGNWSTSSFPSQKNAVLLSQTALSDAAWCHWSVGHSCRSGASDYWWPPCFIRSRRWYDHDRRKSNCLCHPKSCLQAPRQLSTGFFYILRRMSARSEVEVNI